MFRLRNPLLFLILLAMTTLTNETKADSVEVVWPSGHVDKLSDVNAGHIVAIQEGKGIVAARRYDKSWPAAVAPKK